VESWVGELGNFVGVNTCSVLVALEVLEVASTAGGTVDDSEATHTHKTGTRPEVGANTQPEWKSIVPSHNGLIYGSMIYKLLCTYICTYIGALSSVLINEVTHFYTLEDETYDSHDITN
jgi:hypothetical protein